MEYDVIVIGGGPAGLAAAHEAWQQGARNTLIIERDQELGGILNQCIHNGFGLHYFNEELTGPEYAGRFIHLIEKTGVEIMLDTMVLDVSPEKEVTIVSSTLGCRTLKAKAIVLAMGCRERTRGAITIPGSRPAGVFTAGAAQKYINLEGYVVGKRVIILGSGDIGLIMARRLTLEGAQVLACVEVMPYSGGLTRNIVQCLNDFDIPLYLSHTITDIRGKRRVEGVTVSKVDADMRPIPGTEIDFLCDTVLLSVGLIPENELTRAARVEIDPRTRGAMVYENMQTSIPGIFASGNVLHVHDLVDFVTQESQRAGASAAAYALDQGKPDNTAYQLIAGEGVSYTLPQRVRPSHVNKRVDVFFRVRSVMRNAQVEVRSQSGEVLLTFRREHVAPGEMERIPVPKKTLDAIDGDLTIAVKGEQTHG